MHIKTDIELMEDEIMNALCDYVEKTTGMKIARDCEEAYTISLMTNKGMIKVNEFAIDLVFTLETNIAR